MRTLLGGEGGNDDKLLRMLLDFLQDAEGLEGRYKQGNANGFPKH